MTSSVHYSMRYGLWEAPCYRECPPLRFRVTPRSKETKMISPVMVSGVVLVTSVSSSGFTVDPAGLTSVLDSISSAIPPDSNVGVSRSGRFSGSAYSVYSPKLQLLRDAAIQVGDSIRVRFRVEIANICTGEHRLLLKATDALLVHRA